MELRWGVLLLFLPGCLSVAVVDAESLLQKALTHSSEGDYVAAERDYEKILAKKPADSVCVEAHYQLGMLLAYKTSEVRHALYHLDRFLMSETKSAQAASAARVMQKQEDKLWQSPGEEIAIADLVDVKDRRILLRATQIHPHSAAPWYLMARLNEEEGRTGEALQAYRKSVGLSPT